MCPDSLAAFLSSYDTFLCKNQQLVSDSIRPARQIETRSHLERCPSSLKMPKYPDICQIPPAKIFFILKCSIESYFTLIVSSYTGKHPGIISRTLIILPDTKSNLQSSWNIATIFLVILQTSTGIRMPFQGLEMVTILKVAMQSHAEIFEKH